MAQFPVRQTAGGRPASAASAYRAGVRSTAARRAHIHELRTWRHNVASTELPLETLQAICDRLTAGEQLGDVLDALDVRHQQIWGRARWDPEWSATLEAALMTGRDPQLPHGTDRAYTARCRCRECRDDHRGRTSRDR